MGRPGGRTRESGVRAAVAVSGVARAAVGSGSAGSPAGAVFAVHPLHVEAVANLVGRSELLAALFVLAACHVHLGGPRSADRIAAVAALYLLGLGSKEIAVTLPALLLVLDAFRDRVERRGPRTLLARNAPLLAALAGTLGLYLLLRVQANGGLLGQAPAAYLIGISPSTRVATAVSLWPEYSRCGCGDSLSADWGPGCDLAGGDPRTGSVCRSARRCWRPRARVAAPRGRPRGGLLVRRRRAPSRTALPHGTLLASGTLSLLRSPSFPPRSHAAGEGERRVVRLARLRASRWAGLGAARTWKRTPVWAASDACSAMVDGTAAGLLSTGWLILPATAAHSSASCSSRRPKTRVNDAGVALYWCG